MVKVVVLFCHAADPKALDDYYYNHYLPTVLKVPGIIKVEVTRFYSDLKKVFLKQTDITPDYIIQSELYFEDLKAFEYGFSTKIGEYIANDTIQVAWELVTVMIGDSVVVTPESYEREPSFIRRMHRV